MNRFRTVVMIMAFGMAFGCPGCKSKTATQSTSSAGPDSSAAHPVSAPITNPCNLLTQQEASRAIGEQLKPGDLQNFGPITRCRFRNVKDAGNEDLWLDVGEHADTFDSLGHLPDTKAVSGIGDGALWQHNEYATFLHILKGGNFVSLGLPRTMTTMTPEVEKAGKLVAGRM